MVGERDNVGGYACFFADLEGVDERDFVGEAAKEFMVGGEGDDDFLVVAVGQSVYI